MRWRIKAFFFIRQCQSLMEYSSSSVVGKFTLIFLWLIFYFSLGGCWGRGKNFTNILKRNIVFPFYWFRTKPQQYLDRPDRTTQSFLLRNLNYSLIDKSNFADFKSVLVYPIYKFLVLHACKTSFSFIGIMMRKNIASTKVEIGIILLILNPT